MTEREEVKATERPWRVVPTGRRLRGGRESCDIFGNCNRAQEWHEIVCSKVSAEDANLIVSAVNGQFAGHNTADASCVCGGSPEKPNPDCERCELVARIKQLEGEAAKKGRQQMDVTPSEVVELARKRFTSGEGFILTIPPFILRDGLADYQSNFWIEAMTYSPDGGTCCVGYEEATSLAELAAKLEVQP